MNCTGKASIATFTLALVCCMLAELNALGVTDVGWYTFFWMTAGVLLGMHIIWATGFSRFHRAQAGAMVLGMCVWILVGGLASEAEAQHHDTSESQVGYCTGCTLRPTKPHCQATARRARHGTSPTRSTAPWR